MKLIYKMESVLIAITAVLCTILLLKLLFVLRTIVPWRVNCWFCNSNFWLKYPVRNSWTCPKCDQYNGFTKDGDYNKPLFSSEQALMSPKVFHHSPPRNGLCKMCNINQQLKVTQLANFVPMNDKNYDEEIENYRAQLEKAYKLCSPCKKVVQMKLRKEKETLLGTKLLETRTPEKKNKKLNTQSKRLQNFINRTSKLIACVLFTLLMLECYRNVRKENNLPSLVLNAKGIISNLLERIYCILKMKTLMTFPFLENYHIESNILIDILPKQINFGSDYNLDYVNNMTQKALGGMVCLIQIIGLFWNVNKLTHTILIDLLLAVFMILSIASKAVPLNSVIMSLLKLTSIGALIVVYRSTNTKTVQAIILKRSTPKRMKNLTSPSVTPMEEDELSALDTDDDVSLCKFGLRDFSDSSHETLNPLNNSLASGRCFTPRTNDSLWIKPKMNSSFCVNSLLKTANSASETVFIKPSFKKYQKLTKDDSDSDLDESISSLCIGSPKKGKNNGSVFSLRKFTATPNFVEPTPLNRRPLISPSKLGHSTSWVAGGYWGSEGERQIFNLNGSRSSSQSSGFESQASSMNQRNPMSQPSSREESVCGELDRTATLMDRFQNCNMNSYNANYQGPQNFSRLSSPVFPQMQYNSHVQIPQPRFAQQPVSQGVFVHHQYAQNSTFKTPGGSGLIRLPKSTSFVAR